MVLTIISVLCMFTNVVSASEYEDACSAMMTPLYKACMRGDVDVVKTLIGQGADVNARNWVPKLKQRYSFREESETPVFAAIRAGKPDVLRALLDNGAKVNVKAPRSGTPLHCAVDAGNPEIVRMLIAGGADVNAMAETDSTIDTFAGKSRISPLHAVVYGGDDTTVTTQSKVVIMTMLIKSGAAVDARDSAGGFTPLHCAVKTRQIELVKVLVENGSDVNARARGEFEGDIPLDYAIDHGSSHNVSEIEVYLRAHGAEGEGRSYFLRQEKFRSDAQRNALVNASLALGIPLAYIGGSIYMYESRYKNKRGSNVMGTFNMYALSTISFATAGFVLGYATTTHIAGQNGTIEQAIGGLTGCVAGASAGLAVCYFAHLPRKAKRNRALYYSLPAASMTIPLIVFTASF